MAYYIAFIMLLEGRGYRNAPDILLPNSTLLSESKTSLFRELIRKACTCPYSLSSSEKLNTIASFIYYDHYYYPTNHILLLSDVQFGESQHLTVQLSEIKLGKMLFRTCEWRHFGPFRQQSRIRKEYVRGINPLILSGAFICFNCTGDRAFIGRRLL